jgi:hypothetical protein
MLSERPTLLICKQCGLTRVSDNYHEAKARAEIHGKKSKHYDFELMTLEECPGRVERGPLVHRKALEVQDGAGAGQS